MNKPDGGASAARIVQPACLFYYVPLFPMASDESET
jgi:hypothetical protein